MRRKDYEMKDRVEMEKLLREVDHGFLGLARQDGWPLVIPMNYVYHDERIYVHGARSGERMESLGADDRATFVVVQAFSLIPSYYIDPKLACPATQYYRSVMIKGRARVVVDLEEKAAALQALMEKLQPEGGHDPISASDPQYRKSIETTAVIAVDVEEMKAKFKFGQNVTSERRETVAAQLEARGCPIDHSTVQAMRSHGLISAAQDKGGA